MEFLVQKDNDYHLIDLDSNKKFVKKYLSIIALIINIVILTVFCTFNYMTTKTLKAQLVDQARSFFKEIVVTRQWAAKHGGVYVPLNLSGGVNPYLDKINGVKSVINCDGEKYTLKNPALITRELSESNLHAGKLKYKITSKKLINPNNKPDNFEKISLSKFEKDINENMQFETVNGRQFFRYMAPLLTTKACLKCHVSQGYKVGDIRGGISVSIDAEEISNKIFISRIIMLISGIAIILLIIISIFYISQYFIRDLQEAQNKLRELALYDSLTYLFNRMSGIQTLIKEVARSKRINSDLSIALLDLDFFKKINDTYGHMQGDLVLKEFAKQMKNSTREYDTCCRYGGEEFLLIMPDTSITEALHILDRLHNNIRNCEVNTPKHQIKFTFSGGLVAYDNDKSIDILLERVDHCLYKAKAKGRDCIKVG